MVGSNFFKRDRDDPEEIQFDLERTNELFLSLLREHHPDKIPHENRISKILPRS